MKNLSIADLTYLIMRIKSQLWNDLVIVRYEKNKISWTDDQIYHYFKEHTNDIIEIVNIIYYENNNIHLVSDKNLKLYIAKILNPYENINNEPHLLLEDDIKSREFNKESLINGNYFCEENSQK